MVAAVLSDNLIRPGAHWKIRPASWQHWCGSRLIFFIVWFLFPFGVLQLWTAFDSGFSTGHALLSLLEISIVLTGLFLFVTGIASQARDWKWVLGIAVGCIAMAYLPLLIVDTLFSTSLELPWIWNWIVVGLGRADQSRGADSAVADAMGIAFVGGFGGTCSHTFFRGDLE